MAELSMDSLELFFFMFKIFFRECWVYTVSTSGKSGKKGQHTMFLYLKRLHRSHTYTPIKWEKLENAKEKI